MNYHRSMSTPYAPEKLGLGTKILGTGIYLPSTKVSSKDLFESFNSEKLYGLPTNWMDENMGIIERGMFDLQSCPSELAIHAAENAINSAPHLCLDHIDAVIFCGIERDQPEPATAHQIQKKLGFDANYAFDISNACFGFFDGLRIASSLVQSNAARLVLVCTSEVPTRLTRIVAEKLSKGVDKKELTNSIGFLSVGDAAGAMIIGRSDGNDLSGFTSFNAQTDSKHNSLCSYKYERYGELHVNMQMAKIVAKTFVLHKSIYQKSQRLDTWKAPDFLLTHQIGKRAFAQVANLTGIDQDKMIKSYDLFGNTTSANLPLNYHQLIESKKAKSGDNVHAYYCGSGLACGQLSLTL